MAKTKGISIRDLGDGLKGINLEIFGGLDGFLSMTSGTSTGGGGSDISQAQQLRRVVPWLAKAVDMTANAVSALPFDIINNKGDPYDSSTDWKNKTGGLDSPENLFYLLASSLCFGRAYLIPTMTSKMIADIQFVAPQTVKEEINRDGLQWFDRTTDKGAVSRYYPIESELDPVMAYFWLPDSDIEIGPALTHPAGTALMSARLLFSMDGTIATYAERGFIPPTVLGAKGMPGPAEREKAERWWDRFFRGKTDIAAKIINTEALSVVKVGAGMEDLRGAYPELTKQMIENIGTAFGIPSGLFMSDMAFATEIKHLTKVWYTTSAFVKIYKAIETGFNEQILSEWGLKLKFDPNAIDAMQEEENERAQAFSTYVNAGMRPSVTAQMLGLELPEGVTFEMLDADLLAKQEQEQKLAEAQAQRFQQQDKPDDKVADKEEKKPVKGWVTINGNHVLIDDKFSRDDYSKPSRELLDRAHAVFREFTDGKVAEYIDRQMKGAIDGKPMTPGQKLNNLRRCRDELAIIRERDPEAYDWAIRSSLADEYFRTGSASNFADMPDMIDVYRGDASGVTLPKMTNVSLSEDQASRFGEVTHYQISKYEIDYVNYGSRFDEGEVFIFDTAKLIVIGKPEKSITLSADQIKELNLWRQIAERNFRKGKGACADFEVKTLPIDMADEIRERLKYVTGKEDIGQAFEVTGTPQERGMDNEAIKMLADAINRATDAGVNIDNPS